MNVYAANIAIGGSLPSSALPGLLQAAASCGAGLDWNLGLLQDTEHGAAELLDAVRDAGTEGECLRLYNDSASMGRLDPLETFCRENGLTYRREHDPDHGDSGMVAWWAPGMAEPLEREADSDGEPFVFVKDVAAALDAAASAQDAVAAMRKLVAEASPVDVPPLVLQP